MTKREVIYLDDGYTPVAVEDVYFCPTAAEFVPHSAGRMCCAKSHQHIPYRTFQVMAEVIAKGLRENGWQKTNHRLTWDTALPTTRERHLREAAKLLRDALAVRR